LDISRNGRYVLFASLSTNLTTPRLAPFIWRIYIRDRRAGTTELVSVNTRGRAANSDSFDGAISGNGRYVAFSSGASNLVPDDTNDLPEDDDSDVFVRDRKRETTRRVSLTSTGAQTAGVSFAPDISASGRFVTFTSTGPDLVPGDIAGAANVFVRDLATGQTTLASAATDGQPGEPGIGWSDNSSISGNGRYVVFDSDAANLIPGQSEYTGQVEVFLRDRATRTTTLVSVSSAGQRGDTHSFQPAIAGSGRTIAFSSWATNLTSGDDNALQDVFLYDVPSGTLAGRITGKDGVSGDGDSGAPSLSADGGSVAFISSATNLVPEDGNGATDVFVYTPTTGISRASVGTRDQEGNGPAGGAVLSGTGEVLAFTSAATNLVGTPDRNFSDDVFVRR
jgi:Tol biopolymer transport system component